MAGPPSPRVRAMLAPASPDSLATWLQRYLVTLEALHRSHADRKTRRTRLAHFFYWCEERGIERPQQVTYAHIEGFQRYLFLYRKPNGQPMVINGQIIALVTLQMFFRWLVRQKILPSNPAADLELPKRSEDLREPLTLDEVETVLALPDISEPYGLRDRAVLEVLYATGIRRAELINLVITDIDTTRGTMHVRLGKGRKDRFIPVGERALAWIAKYQREARPQLLEDINEPRLFLNQYGIPLSNDALSYRVRDYFNRAGITKRGACHLFRHTMATAMLDNGADVRHVQEMLGHSAITSTQRYTHVSIGRLVIVHAATHPAARLLRPIEDSNGDT